MSTRASAGVRFARPVAAVCEATRSPCTRLTAFVSSDVTPSAMLASRVPPPAVVSGSTASDGVIDVDAADESADASAGPAVQRERSSIPDTTSASTAAPASM